MERLLALITALIIGEVNKFRGNFHNSRGSYFVWTLASMQFSGGFGSVGKDYMSKSKMLVCPLLGTDEVTSVLY